MPAALLVRGAAGVVMLAGGVLLLVTSTDLVGAAHPAYGVALAVLTAIGLAVVIWAVVRARAARARRPHLVGAGLLLLLSVALVGAMVWVRPFGPTAVAVDAMHGVAGVTVTEAPTRITLSPANPRAGLVFQPGARVDARAYVPLLEQVAQAGYLVVVVKQPFGIGFLSVDAPAEVRRDHPTVTRWAIGGHSLGGVAAASYAAASDVAGLVLWASYPASSIADRTGLRVVSVSGSADGLATPAKVDAAKPLLPEGTSYVVVAGGIHAYFGDYGPQDGDGTPTVSRATAQEQIVQATVGLLDSI